MELSGVSKRMKDFLKTLPSSKRKGRHMSEREYEGKSGLNPGAISGWGEGLHSDTISKIKEFSPKLNIDWLLQNKGEMIIKEDAGGYSGLANASKNLTEEPGKQTNTDMVLLNLSESHKALAEAHRDIAKSNRSLTDTNKELAMKSNSDAAKGSQPKPEVLTIQTLRKMAKEGVPGLWKTADQGLVILGKLVIGDYKAKSE